MVETSLNLTGLAITALGAFIAAWAVIISDDQAKLLSGTYYGGNNAMCAALRKQSRDAKRGLMCVGFGTLLQATAIIYPLIHG